MNDFLKYWDEVFAYCAGHSVEPSENLCKVNNDSTM